jgi:hypothetical protein
MDDQLLEKRLDSLRKAYSDMPEDENRSEILAAIKKEQKKSKQTKWFHLPYAASFIGVGMIAGVLMMQYINDFGISNSEKPGVHQTSGDSTEKKGELSESEVNEKITALQAYYSERQTYTKEKLGFGAGYADLLYQNIPMELSELEAEMRENPKAYDREKFEQVTAQIKREINEAFTMPSEIIEKLSHGVNEQQYEKEDEYNLLVQLDSYLMAYRQSFVLYEWEINKALEQDTAAEVVAKLNAGGKGISTPGLKKLAEGAVRNGYTYREEAGKIEIHVDYMSIAKKLKPEGNPDFVYYLELRSNNVQDLQGDVRSYKDLGQLLVKFEKSIKVVQDRTIDQWMRNDVQSLYGLFVEGHPEKSIFNDKQVLKEEVKNGYRYVIETFPNTDTGAAIKIFFEQLEKNNFMKPADFSIRAVIYPKYLNLRTPDQSEIMFTQSILPLTSDMQAAYKEFAAKKDNNLLRDYGPFEMMQLYFHADKEKDYAVKYALYSKNEAIPSEEQYVKEQKAAGMDLSGMLNGYDHASFYISEENPNQITGVQLHFRDTSDTKVFQMVQEDGVWKVRYMPLQ